MISKTQIRYMANSSSYSKGAELYATGKVLDMDVKNMGASDEIVASVKGSGRNIYEVDVSIQRMMKLIPAIVNVGHMQNMVDFVNIV